MRSPFRLIPVFLALAFAGTPFLTRADWQPGLRGGYVTGSFNKTDFPAVTNIYPDTPAATNSSALWGDRRTWVYWGQVYLDGSPCFFAEKIDDNTHLKIDGTVYIENGGDYQSFVSSSKIELPAGWHDIEVRFYNGTGGAGPNQATCKEGFKCGFGFYQGETPPASMSDCSYLSDPGDMSVYRYDDGTGFADNLQVRTDPLGLPCDSVPPVGLTPLAPGQQLACSAPETLVSDHLHYKRVGYATRSGLNGEWTSWLTNNTPTFEYTHTEAGRIVNLVWLYEQDGYQLDAAGCREEDGVSIVPGPDLTSGCYSPGKVVTITATPAEGATFAAWHGDFEGSDSSPTTAVTMDRPRVIRYQTGWTYADGLLTDGNWVFEVTGKGDELSIKTRKEVGEPRTLDFRSPILDRSGSPYHLVSIGANGCKGLLGLKKVYLPETLRSIGESCFNGCADLETVEPFLPASLTSIGHYVFNGCSKLGGDLVLSNPKFTTLTYYAFYKTAVTGVDMRGSGVTAMGEYWYGDNCSFMGCTSLTNVFLSDGIEVIGQSAFSGCRNLEQVTPFLPETVRHVGRTAFNGCSKLRGDLVLMSPKLTTLYYYSFAETAITSLDMGRSGAKKMPGAQYGYNRAFYNCTSLTNAILPPGIEEIGDGAFLGCVNLEKVTPFLPATVKAVWNQAFSGCKKLTGELVVSSPEFKKLNIQSFSGTAITKADLSKTAIVAFGAGSWSLNQAFNDCLSLQEVYLPPDLPDLGKGMFMNCDKLESVYFRGKPPVKVQPEVFRSIPAYTTCLYYPRHHAEWETFGSTNFVALTEEETALFQEMRPGEKLPVGTWRLPSSEKQWVSKWLPPEEARNATMLLLR